MNIKIFNPLFPLLLMTAFSVTIFSSADGDALKTEFDHTHGVFSAILDSYVSDGMVSYEELLKNRDGLDAYITSLTRVSHERYRRFSVNERLAFLINAYNAFTIDLILQHYPVSSILDIPNAWDDPEWVLLDSSRTLNHIEHEIIRKEFDEPLIHFALVCAAIGCPKLPSIAFRADSLENQLKSSAEAFIRDGSRNRLERESGILHLSKIFEWYGEDFVSRWGDSPVPDARMTAVDRSLVGVFQAYGTVDDSLFLTAHPVAVHFLEYDWGLNDPRP